MEVTRPIATAMTLLRKGFGLEEKMIGRMGE